MRRDDTTRGEAQMTEDVMNNELTRTPRRRQSRGGGGGGGGFTLTELLVVMGIIVMILAMALPLFNAMTGSRSVEAAQNRVSAMLERARSRAIGLQERRGVYFFNDTVTGQVAMIMVRVIEPTVQPPANATAATVAPLELDEDYTEPELLPKGVGAAFYPPEVKSGEVSSVAPRVNGLIMFDGLGRLQLINGAPFGDATSALTSAYAKRWTGASTSAGATEWSTSAMFLFDKTAMANLEPSTKPEEFSDIQKGWLNQNATLLVISRYNGTVNKGD